MAVGAPFYVPGGPVGKRPLAPSAPTISGTLLVGNALTITPGAGGGPVTSYVATCDGRSLGAVANGHTFVAGDIGVSYTVQAVGPGGTSAPSNALVGIQNTVAYWPIDATLGSIVDYTGRGNTLAADMVPAVSTVPFQIGGNYGNGSQQVTGGAARYGVWKRDTSSAEDAAIAGGEAWPFNTTISLRDAAAYFLLNEASGATTYADATGRGNDLTKVSGGGVTTRVAGPSGSDFGVRMSGGVVVLQRSPVTADLQTGNVAQTTACWVYMDSLGAGQQVFGGQFDGNIRTGIVVYYHAGNARFQIDFGDDIDLYRNAIVVDATLGPPSTGTWYCIIAKYDPVANQLTLKINGGTPTTLAAIQQPLPVSSGAHLSAQFRKNPDYRATGLSGWDLVNQFCSASLPITADLSIGNNPKGVLVWVKYADHATTQTLMGVFDSSNNHLDWVIQQASGVVYFLLGDAAGNFNFCSVALNDNNWHQVVCSYDKNGDGKIHISRDNGAATGSASLTHTPATSALAFLMGNAHDGAARNQQLYANMCLAVITSSVPSTNDIANHYAMGTGLT